MKKLFALIFPILLFWMLQKTNSLTTSVINSQQTVRNTSDLIKVEKIIDSGKFTKLTINVKANTYILYDTFRINQSNVSIIIEPGTKVVLADHINKPVIAIGSQEQTPTTTIAVSYTHLRAHET